MLVCFKHSTIRLSIWLLETGTLFPWRSSQQHITFNLSRPASTDTFDSDPIPKALLIFTIQGSTANYRECSFWCNFFVYQYHYKKKSIWGTLKDTFAFLFFILFLVTILIFIFHHFSTLSHCWLETILSFASPSA